MKKKESNPQTEIISYMKTTITMSSFSFFFCIFVEVLVMLFAVCGKFSLLYIVHNLKVVFGAKVQKKTN